MVLKEPHTFYSMLSLVTPCNTEEINVVDQFTIRTRQLPVSLYTSICMASILLCGQRGQADDIERQLTMRPKEARHFQNLAISPDGKILVLADVFHLRIWDLVKNKERPGIELPEVVSSPNYLSFAPDGLTLALATTDDIPCLLDISRGKIKTIIKKPSVPSIRTFSYSPDGKTLVIAGIENGLLWDLKRGSARAILPPSHAAAFSSDGKILAMADSGSEIHLLQTDSGKPSRGLAFDVACFNELAYSPNGKVLAGVIASGVYFLNVRSGKVEGAFGKGRGQTIRKIAFSPDGRMLAVRIKDGTLHLVEMLTGQERCILRGLGNYSQALAFSPDGRTLASDQEDGYVILWKLATVKRRNVPDAAELKQFWTTLQGRDAAAAYRDIRILTTFPSQTLPFLEKQLQSFLPPAELLSKIERWVAELDSDNFDTREKASRELRQAGDWAEAVLRRALVGNPSAELRRRAAPLLARLKTSNKSDELLAPRRALEVLEHIGTAPARKILQRLATGMAKGPLGEEAAESLARLRKHPPPTIIKPLPPKAPVRPKAAPSARR
jgi:hypothetical protein